MRGMLQKKLKLLPAFLRGPAAQYFHSLADDKKDTYANLVKNLKAVLCPAVDREKFFSDFEQRKLRPNEDPSLFLWTLTDILSKADPDLNDEARTALLSRQFMKGLPSHLRLKLLENNPTPSLEEMTAFVQRFRAVYPLDVSPTLHAHVTDGDPLQASIAQLTAAVAALASDQKDLRASLSSPPPQVQPRHQPQPMPPSSDRWQNNRRSSNQPSTQRCFNCNQIGHFARSCPFDPHCQLCRGWGHTQSQCANNSARNYPQVSGNSLNFRGVPQ